MRITRLIVATILLILAVPVWRSFDWIAIIWPHNYAMASILGLWSAIFLCLPIKLIRPKIHPLLMMLPFLIFWTGAMLSHPLSKMSTNDYRHNHCGRFTFTGIFYPLSPVLSDAFRDDLEARNQMCWVRKMISRVPDAFDSHEEVNLYLDLIQKRLLAPEYKYRVALPLVLILLGKSLHSWNTTYGPIEQVQGGMMLAKGIPYWTDQYNHEISLRKYSWANWPHSALIQFEYGIIEKNWEKIQIMVEEN
jgi:hypothetical protein